MKTSFTNFSSERSWTSEAPSTPFWCRLGTNLGCTKLSLRARRRLQNSRATQRQTNVTFREWLNCQAAGGYVTYDKSTEEYLLSEEQELCLANQNGPVDLPGARLLMRLLQVIFAGDEGLRIMVA
jgi:hypothetical protein